MQIDFNVVLVDPQGEKIIQGSAEKRGPEFMLGDATHEALSYPGERDDRNNLKTPPKEEDVRRIYGLQMRLWNRSPKVEDAARFSVLDLEASDIKLIQDRLWERYKGVPLIYGQCVNLLNGKDPFGESFDKPKEPPDA